MLTKKKELCIATGERRTPFENQAASCLLVASVAYELKEVTN